MPTHFDLAPPPKTVDGLACVPVDISSVDAVFTFDGAAGTAEADATLTYTLGPAAGNPVFDLRQAISQAWLDGAPFPPAKLAHHVFGSGSFTDLRVIESAQAAGSVHTLRVLYPLALPGAQLGGSYLPALDWSPGPRLRFVFGLSDLNRARYAEAWLPANLLFDQYATTLEVRVTGTAVPHAVITNGAVTVLGPNHWTVAFPDRFTALSPLLEVRPADALVQQTGSVVLPVSGTAVTIEAWTLTGSGVDLGAQIATLQGLLAANETAYGPYVHGNRFVAFFNGGSGMEYEGGTTTAPFALAHETFHSWFARGIKPASQADGWWDEAFTTFHDDGADDAEPFDFADPPVLLCTRDPWQRHTPSNAYSDGARFWRGMAALVAPAPLNAGMAEAYQRWKGEPVSTAMLEESLLCSTGTVQVVDAFHRFVYGLADPSPPPDLWLRDALAHTGADQWDGAFWDSPDLWIRNADDGGTDHQEPEHGQDNWFHARVRNRGAGACAHFVVTFRARGFAGTEFVYPADFLPCTGAAAAFDLAPGGERVVKARWPRALVPPAGTHTCLLASVLARGDHPVSGRHVWEHNNLAQRNLTVVDLQLDDFIIVPIVLGNWVSGPGSRFELEVWGGEAAGLSVGLVHHARDFFRHARVEVRELAVAPAAVLNAQGDAARLECGGVLGPAPRGVMSARTPERVRSRYPHGWEAVFPPDATARIAVEIPPASQRVVGLRVAPRPRAKPGPRVKVHLVQRNAASGRVVGGVAVQVNLRGGTVHHS